MTVTISQLNTFFFAFSILSFLLCAWLFYRLSRFIIVLEEKVKPGSMTDNSRFLIYALFSLYFIFMVIQGLTSGVLSLNRFQQAQSYPAAAFKETKP